MKLTRKENGEWHFPTTIKNAHSSYQPALEKYLNALDPFFARAKEKCEFEFIFSLLRVRGLAGPGWDTLRNLAEVYKSFDKINKLLRDDNVTPTHFSLFLYGLTIEASEPYELLSNLINVIEDKRYNPMSHFPDYSDGHGKMRSMSPADKITQIKSRAKKVKLNLQIFDEFFDNKLRNSVFHSDYAVYNNEIRLMNPAVVYSRDDWHKLINCAIAYYEALMTLYKYHIGQYAEPKLVKPHPDLSPDKELMFVTIIRTGHGLIGLRDNWTPEQLANGRIPYVIGRFLPYEQKLVAKGQRILPRNKIERINTILKWLPKAVNRQLVKKLSKYY